MPRAVSGGCWSHAPMLSPGLSAWAFTESAGPTHCQPPHHTRSQPRSVHPRRPEGLDAMSNPGHSHQVPFSQSSTGGSGASGPQGHFLTPQQLRRLMGGSIGLLAALFLASGSLLVQSPTFLKQSISVEPWTGAAQPGATESAQEEPESAPGLASLPEAAGGPEALLRTPLSDRILAITPTYPRAFQELHLTRQASTIRQVAAPFLWIVVESPEKTAETASILERTARLCLPLGHPHCRKVEYVHLGTGEIKTEKGNAGSFHRNRALDYIEERRLEGIVYFMDDDNTYTPQLFDELRGIKRVGILPVGFLFVEEYTRLHRSRLEPQAAPYKHPFLERPLVQASPVSGQSEIFGYELAYQQNNLSTLREFSVDMAGFTFRSFLLWMPEGEDGYPRKPLRFTLTKYGFLENDFLLKLVRNATYLEPLADRCTEVWVYHLHTEAKKTAKYPTGGWFFEQPAALVPVEESVNSTWPFLVDGTRHGIEGRDIHGEALVHS